MSSNEFSVPFMSRAEATATDDGMELCVLSKVVIQSNILLVFDQESGSQCPLVVVPLSALTGLTAKKFRSGGRRYCGGRIELYGNFGRPWPEKLVLKMELPDYDRMRAALKAVM